MTELEFSQYTQAINQLIGYCKHFGFDDDDTAALVEYCKIGAKNGLIPPEQIASIVSYKNSLQVIPVSTNIEASLITSLCNLSSMSISDILDKAISEIGVDSLICPSQDNSFIKLTVSSLNNAATSITTLPFTNRVIIRVRGSIELIGYYLEMELDQYKDEMIERGFVPINDNGLVIKGRYGLPVKV